MHANDHNHIIYVKSKHTKHTIVLVNLSTPNELISALGARLKTQRLAQGFSQSDLAGMAGVSVGAVQLLESSGRSSLITLARVAQALGLAGELDSLFVLKTDSIAKLERAAAAKVRQRAPRKRARP